MEASNSTAMVAFDVTKFELEDSAVLILQNAAGDDDLQFDGKVVTVRVWGPGSKQGVRAMHVAGRHAAMRMAGIVRGKVSKNAAEDADTEKVEKLTMITAEFTNFPYEGGAQAIYANPKLCYIADQVDAFFGDKANFSKPSTPNSGLTSDTGPG